MQRDIPDADNEYEPVRVRKDWTEEASVVYAVINAVSIAKNVEPTDLRPLGEILDADALEALVRNGAGPTGESVVVSFSYEDCEITVGAAGEVEVRPPAGTDRVGELGS